MATGTSDLSGGYSRGKIREELSVTREESEKQALSPVGFAPVERTAFLYLGHFSPWSLLHRKTPDSGICADQPVTSFFACDKAANHTFRVADHSGAIS
jgi:hypothetical protein